jgi:class 3 adenylate cyclase
MQKVAPLNPGMAQDPAATTSRVVPFPTAGDRTNRTSVCAVLFLDIAEYSRKPVSEQLQVKERFNAHIAEAIAEVVPDERIILDTGDGVAISFLGDPEDALFVALNLAEALGATAEAAQIAVRAGINLGPVRLVRDINSQPNIIGDGINVAQRVMSFAHPGQVLVSRSYYDVITRISEDYSRLFVYQGSRTDKHVREHELYELAAPGSAALDIVRQRNRVRRPGEDTLTSATQPGARLLGNRRLAFAFTGFSIFALSAAAVYYGAPAPAPSPAERPVAARVAAAPVPVPEPVRVAPAPDPAPAMPSPLHQSEPVSAASAAAGRPDAPAPAVPAPPSAKRSSGIGSALPAKPARARAPEPASQPSAPVQEPRPAFALVPSEPAPEVRAEPVQQWAPKTRAGRAALVLLAISPWGEVFVNGKPAGVSPPMAELELEPGKYRIEVRNGAFKPYEEDVELASNQTVRIKHKFTQQR